MAWIVVACVSFWINCALLDYNLTRWYFMKRWGWLPPGGWTGSDAKDQIKLDILLGPVMLLGNFVFLYLDRGELFKMLAKRNNANYDGRD